MARVLVVDDEPGVRFSVGEVLLERGHEVVGAESAERALELAENTDLVVTDLMMPGMNGVELLRALRDKNPTLPVILLTARGSERAAVEAMKAGAFDYLTKPYDIDELALAVERADDARRLKQDSRRLRAERDLGGSVIGESAAIQRMLETIERVAKREVPVLVRGETGTGKELVGGLLHALGLRARGPLVRFNCSAIPHELAEAELFGHARGAFTGAGAARRGWFAQAHGGTLVLDEVGELPPAIQPKLLRALEYGEIQPLGGRPERVDVRVVACTHRDLEALARAGSFRDDLYYRLCVVVIDVPSLRERRGDIPLLAQEFLRRYATRFGLDDVRLSSGLLAELARRDWPGNVRELENTIARLVALSRGGEIGAEALARALPASVEKSPQTLRERVESYERSLIAAALERSAGNQSAAARSLGVSRVTLIDKLKRYGLL